MRPVAATARPFSAAHARIAALTRVGVDAARCHRSPARRPASASTAASHSRTAAGVTDASDCSPSRTTRGRAPPTTGTSASIHRSSSRAYSARVLGARSPRVAIHPRNHSPSGCSPSRGSCHTPRAIRDTSCASAWSASAFVGYVPSVRIAPSGPVYLACHRPEGSLRTAPDARRCRREVVEVVMIRTSSLWHVMARPTRTRVSGRSDRAVEIALTCGNNGAGDGNRTRAISLGSWRTPIPGPQSEHVSAGRGAPVRHQATVRDAR